MPIFQLQELYQDTWVVLDRAYQVVDSGERLDDLRRKHGSQARRTFCYVSGPGGRQPEAPAAPWSLRALLDHEPAALELA
jgi:hypothetical protein